MVRPKFEVIEGIVENLSIFDADVNYSVSSAQHEKIAGIVSVAQEVTG